MTNPDDTSAWDRDCAIGFDVGGTKIAAGVVTAEGRVLHKRIVPSPREAHADALPQAILALSHEMRNLCPGVSAVGVGAAGMIDWPSGHIRWAPNSSYADLPLQKILATELGLPASVENDANAAAWAEVRVGAGSGHRQVIVLTVGTGIGCGIIVNGKLYRGWTGISGEVGHIVVNPANNIKCGCGVTGCLETMASGNALGRAGRLVAADNPNGVIASLAGSSNEVTGEIVFQAASRGDSVAVGLFEDLGYWLGIGVASLVTAFDPELVIVTGGLVATGELLFAPTRASFERFVFARDRRSLPPIVPAILGTEAGLIGAALLALDRKLEGLS